MLFLRVSSSTSLCTLKRRCSCPVIRARARPSHADAGPAQQQQLAFKALEAATPICCTQLSESVGSRGLVASSTIQPGQTVLQLPHCNSLTVNTRGNVYSWECQYLEPWETAHGALPDSLAYYLTEVQLQPVVRLAMWVLYLRKHGNAFWRSWVQLLPPLSDATYPGGFWSEEELQQLQLEPAQSIMSLENSRYSVLCREVFNLLTTELKELHLADSVSDVLWAVFIANTRSHADRSCMCLHPLHDFMNHSDDFNCAAANTADGYCVNSVSKGSIAPETELTISYAPPEGLSNAELLLSWGFTTPARPQDLALPLTHHALPRIALEVAAKAAAAVLVARWQPAAGSDKLGVEALPEADMQAKLQAVAASLPLQPPTAAAAEALQLSTTRSALELASSMHYCHAANLLTKYGSSSSSSQAAASGQAQPDSQAGQASGIFELYQVPKQHQLPAVQDAFLHAVGDVLFERLNGAFGLASGSEHFGGQQQRLQWQQQMEAECLQGCTLHELQLQQMAAAALGNEVQLLLLQCSTTLQHDELLLQVLQRQQQQQQQQQRQQQQRQQQQRQPVTEVVVAAAAVGASGAGTPVSAQTQAAPTAANMTRSGRLFPQPPSVPAAAMPTAAGAVAPQIEAQLHQQRQQQLVIQIQQLQQQVVRQLMLLRASYSLTATATASSRSSNSSNRAAEAAAARQVIAALQGHKGEVLAPLAVEHLKQQAALAQQQQEGLMQLQQQCLQLQPGQQQSSSTTASDAAAAALPDAVQAALTNPGISRRRLATAVAARLEQKRLLLLCCEICKSMEQSLARMVRGNINQ